MLRITAVSAGAVDYLIRGSGCCAKDAAHEHEHGLTAEQAREHEQARLRAVGPA
ncbi:hypothetical protein I4I73_04790, partial [Pseudonocardia sp. KRD-184]|nr:hypothetical protein [Pseudonocardia oceani]